jgi:hypothetical protein
MLYINYNSLDQIFRNQCAYVMPNGRLLCAAKVLTYTIPAKTVYQVIQENSSSESNQDVP